MAHYRLVMKRLKVLSRVDKHMYPQLALCSICMCCPEKNDCVFCLILQCFLSDLATGQIFCVMSHPQLVLMAIHSRTDFLSVKTHLLFLSILSWALDMILSLTPASKSPSLLTEITVCMWYFQETNYLLSFKGKVLLLCTLRVLSCTLRIELKIAGIRKVDENKFSFLCKFVCVWRGCELLCICFAMIWRTKNEQLKQHKEQNLCCAHSLLYLSKEWIRGGNFIF